jgi:hypothetical protein
MLYYCSLFITISVCIYYPDVYTSSNEIYPLTQCTRFSENELSQKSFLQLFHIKGAARNTIQASNITFKKNTITGHKRTRTDIDDEVSACTV